MKYKTMKLGEVANVTMGQSPKSQFYNQVGQGIEFLQGVRTFENNYPKYDTYTTEYKKEAHEGDILFSVRAPVGEINWADRTVAIGRGLASIEARDGYSSKYLYYYLKKIGPRLDSKATGTVFTSINRNELLDIDIIIPENLEDQERLGNRLFILDKKIELNNKINTNLFGLSETIFNNILEEETIKLSEITTIQNGYAFKSSEYIQDEQLMVLRTKNIGINNLFSKDDVVYISKENLEKYSKFSFKQFDTVIVMVGASIGRTGFLTSNIVPSLQNQNMWRFRPLNSKMPGLILYQYINYINTRVKNSASGSARSFYTKKIFNEFDVPRINTAYYKTFSKLQEQIDNLSKETEELKKIKSILLNEYF